MSSLFAVDIRAGHFIGTSQARVQAKRHPGITPSGVSQRCRFRRFRVEGLRPGPGYIRSTWGCSCHWESAGGFGTAALPQQHEPEHQDGLSWLTKDWSCHPGGPWTFRRHFNPRLWSGRLTSRGARITLRPCRRALRLRRHRDHPIVFEFSLSVGAVGRTGCRSCYFEMIELSSPHRLLLLTPAADMATLSRCGSRTTESKATMRLTSPHGLPAPAPARLPPCANRLE